MGGIALGKGVMSSGLLAVMDSIIRKLITGYSLYSIVLILSPVVLVGEILIRYRFPFMSKKNLLHVSYFYQIVSTFISHTIAAVLLVPIAKEVGSNLGADHKNLLIFITGLICSAGMGMPVSGFPNQTALVLYSIIRGYLR